MLCPSCGRESPEGFRFCGHCSAPLEAEATNEVRKTVTVVFCDVTGSTSMGERLDPETVRRVMGRYFGEMRSVLESHGGTVEKFIGDAVMAMFGVPAVHEDDALRAVRAAQQMRERLRALNVELEREHGVSIVARIGVNTGEVVVGAGTETMATGDAINVAARLEQGAPPGGILIGDATRALVRDAVELEQVEPLELKGKADRVPAFLLVSVEGSEGVARRFDVPMVGRAAELRALAVAIHRAERDRACELVAVIGAAGIGKSRLVREFLDRRRAPTAVVWGHCLSYGEGITYWPIVEVMTVAAAIDRADGPDAVRTKIAGLMGGAPDADIVVGRLGQLVGLPGAEAAPEETHWAVRRLLEAIAADRPLTVVIEDVHWAEPAMLELIEHVTDRSRAPILLLCTARPELVERSPGWSEGRRNASTLALGPLSEADSEELVANLLDRIELPSAARQRILEAAEGNPLFVEHMVAMLVEGGVLRRDGDRWVVEGDLIDLSTPSSIGALIEARLERLPPEERTALERASIEGRRFHAGWVRALDTAAAPASAALDSLVGRDLIQPDRSAFAGDDGFRFRHILVRDAAYRRMAKRTRAELHERHAGWLEAVEGGRIAELDEIVGFHLEQAYQLRLELGPLDEAAAALAPRAAGHLIASGRRAAARGDVGASTRLLSRSAELLPAAHPDRASLLIDLAVELIDAGEFDLATATIAELSEADGIASDPSLDLAMRFAALRLESQIRPEGVAEKMEAEAQEAIPLLEALGDDRRLAQAWFLLGQVALFSADNAGQLDAWGRALDHAGRAGDAPVAAQAAVWCMLALVSGMTPAEDALRAIDEVVAKAPPSLDVGAWSKIMRGRCLAMLGDLERGRSLAREGRATFLELGRALTFGSSTMETSPIDEVAGDVDAAERELRDGYEQLVTLGDRAYLSTAAGRLARCVALRGDLVEAEELADVCEASSASDDLYSQVAWRQARALVLAQRTDADGALRLAHEAVALSRGSDDCLLRALALEDLAEVHRLSGRIAEAVGSLEGAMDLWQDKGAVAVVDRLRLRLAELTAP